MRHRHDQECDYVVNEAVGIFGEPLTFTQDDVTFILHYAQTVFEGLKAYRQQDGGLALFRPERNAARLAASCRRLALPEFPGAKRSSKP